MQNHYLRIAVTLSLMFHAAMPLLADEYGYGDGDDFGTQWHEHHRPFHYRRSYGGGSFVPLQISVPHYSASVSPAPALNAALHYQRKMQFNSQFARQQANMASLVERKRRLREMKLMLARSRVPSP